MLQNSQPRRNIRSFRQLKLRRPGQPVMAAKAANLSTVRLSSGISANILDLRLPQKHVLVRTGWVANGQRVINSAAAQDADGVDPGESHGSLTRYIRPAGPETPAGI